VVGGIYILTLWFDSCHMGVYWYVFTGNYWYLLVFTGNVCVVDSNVSRSRADRAQLSVLLDAGLVVSVRSAARLRGMSIVAFVEGALEVALDGYVDVGAGGSVGSSEESVGVRPVDGRDCFDGVVAANVRGGVAPDWDAIFAAGREAKVSVPVSQVTRVVDPIEEIA
jgi:hypothetical protein